MRLRINGLLIAASTLVASIGCEEPKEVIPVAPPGFELTRTPSTPQGDGAQALGESVHSAAPPPKKQAVPPELMANSPPTPIGQPTKTASGLVYETLKEGTGAVSKSGDSVEMHYTGMFEDGTKFDSSLDRNKTLPVTLGSGGVIKGWDEGIPGMKVGEKRKLTIPAPLAYGERGKDKIPPNATLVFEVELVRIK